MHSCKEQKEEIRLKMVGSSAKATNTPIADLWDGVVWLGKFNSRIDGFRYGDVGESGTMSLN